MITGSQSIIETPNIEDPYQTDSHGNPIVDRDSNLTGIVGGTELGKITYGQDGTIISDTAPMPRGLNRDVNNSQEITKDMITGALDGTMTIDNRIFTAAGRESIGGDFRGLGGNTKVAIAGAAGTVDRGFEFLGKVPGLGEDSPLRHITGIVSSPFSLLGETGSYLRNKDGVVNQDDLAAAGKDYIVPGQATGEKSAIKEIGLNEDAVVRVNPTDGAIGDTLKSGGMIFLNLIGLSDMVAMNRIVAYDKYIIATSDSNIIRNLNFHSQGTIIDQGSNKVFANKYPNTIMPTTNSLSEKITYYVEGYAVYPTTTNNLYNNISGGAINEINKNLVIDRDERDPIQRLAAPTLNSNPMHIIIENFNSANPLTILNNLKQSFDSHGRDNQMYDKGRSSVDLRERIRINDNRGAQTQISTDTGTEYKGLPNIK